jgi:hypothetical protein
MKFDYTYENFGAGLDLSRSDRDIPANAMSGGSNMCFKDGELQTRPGTVVESTEDHTLKSIYRFYQTSLDRTQTITTGDIHVYVDGTSVSTAFTSGQLFNFENYHDTLYMVNGEDGLFKWDGVTLQDVTGSTLADFKLIDVTQNAECLYILEKDGTMWESDLGNAEQFDANAFKRIPITEGAIATRIKTHMSGNIAIYTTNDIFVFRPSYSGTTGPISANSYSLEALDSGFGLVAPKTLVNVDGEHIGLSRSGAFVFTGSKADLFPGWERVKTLFDTADPELLHEACATVHNRKIYFSFASYGSSTNDQTIVYDLGMGIFSPIWEGFSVDQYAVYDGPEDVDKLYFINGAKVCYFDDTVFTDNGTAISCSVETKADNYDKSAADKKTKKARIRTKDTAGNVNFQNNIDNEGWSTAQVLPVVSEVVYGQAGLEYYAVASPGTQTWKWGDGLGIKQLKASLRGKGKFIKYRVSKTGFLKLINITVIYRPRKVR